MAGADKGKKETPPNRPGLRRAFRVAGIIIASGWIFFLGILVGRGTAPVQFDIPALQEQLSQARSALFESEVERFKIPAETQEAPVDLSFYDALRESRKRPVVRQEVPESRKPKEPQKPAEPKAALESPSRAAVGMENKTKVTGEAAVLPQNTTQDSNKPLTLQVASLPSQNDARSLSEDLNKRGFPAFVEPVMIPGKGVWYRVRIGNFDRREDASVMLRQLQKERFQPIIVDRKSS